MAAQAQSSVQVPREIRAEEVDIKSLRSLSYLLAVEWEALGGELDLSPAVLFNIKQNNQGNQGEITFKMLLKWQQMKGADATFGFLGDKLIVVGRADLVKDIHTWKTNGIASNLFAAGLDSTATMLIWFVLLLTKHQDVQKKLREEVDAVIGRDRLPTLKDRDSMTYVKAVMQEAHRFVSVAPMGMFHVSATDAEWEGHFIPKGTYLIANYWGMHHDERIFPKPFEFNPERFLNESGEFVKSKYVTPYGIGKRICPGEVLAQRELFLFVTQLVQSFDMQPAEGVDAKSMNSEGVYDGVGFFAPEFEARFLTL